MTEYDHAVIWNGALDRQRADEDRRQIPPDKQSTFALVSPGIGSPMSQIGLTAIGYYDERTWRRRPNTSD